jgi:excisionase family DNA binding protein
LTVAGSGEAVIVTVDNSGTDLGCRVGIVLLYMSIDLENYLTQREAAKYLGLSFNTVRVYAYCGRIKSEKILGRLLIPKDALEEFNQRRKASK